MEFEKPPLPHMLEAELVLIERDLKNLDLIISTLEDAIKKEDNSKGVQPLSLQLLELKAQREELLGKQTKIQNQLTKK